jgi:hypothetical protein
VERRDFGIVADGEPGLLDGLIVSAQGLQGEGEVVMAKGCRRVERDGPTTLIFGLIKPADLP